MKRFDMEIQPQPYYMGEGESPLTVSPYESTNGDWVKWDDVQKLIETLNKARRFEARPFVNRAAEDKEYRKILNKIDKVLNNIEGTN